MSKDDAWNLVDMLVSYFSNLADVKDGPYGEQLPNKEMQFRQSCEELLEWIEKQS